MLKAGDFNKYAGARDWFFRNVIKRVAPGHVNRLQKGMTSMMEGFASGEGLKALTARGQPFAQEMFGRGMFGAPGRYLHRQFVLNPAMGDLARAIPRTHPGLVSRAQSQASKFFNAKNPSQLRLDIDKRLAGRLPWPAGSE